MPIHHEAVFIISRPTLEETVWRKRKVTVSALQILKERFFVSVMWDESGKFWIEGMVWKGPTGRRRRWRTGVTSIVPTVLIRKAPDWCSSRRRDSISIRMSFQGLLRHSADLCPLICPLDPPLRKWFEWMKWQQCGRAASKLGGWKKAIIQNGYISERTETRSTSRRLEDGTGRWSQEVVIKLCGPRKGYEVTSCQSGTACPEGTLLCDRRWQLGGSRHEGEKEQWYARRCCNPSPG